jgi:putative Holliday junction resolvase
MNGGAPELPLRPARSYLAFDYGLKRLGVATGNTVMCRAQALKTLHDMGDQRFAAIEQLIREWQPDALVVGVPVHPDGAPHENTRRAQRFARRLQGRTGLPVHQVDERYSTVQAKSEGAQDVDAAAAAVILQQFLDQQE